MQRYLLPLAAVALSVLLLAPAFAYADDNMGETNHCQTDANKRCGNGEDMDADVGF